MHREASYSQPAFALLSGPILALPALAKMEPLEYRTLLLEGRLENQVALVGPGLGVVWEDPFTLSFNEH